MSFFTLKQSVIDNCFCCGCGICAAVCPAGNLSMQENEYGEIIPIGSKKCKAECSICTKVCPFADGNADEDMLGNKLFGGQTGLSQYDTMGWVLKGYVGRVKEFSARMQSPSGGMTTAVLAEMMHRGEIDAAIVIHQIPDRPWFRSTIAASPDSVYASRGSVYHVTDHADSLRQVIEGPEHKYAIVALPCVAKGLRLAQGINPKLKQRIPFILGLTCGGCRSRLFADILSGLTGSAQGKIKYRSKRLSKEANDFSFSIDLSRKSRGIKFRGLFGFLWMNGVAELKACLFCDDIYAELADATFMDAWLPDYAEDPSGMNLILSRNSKLSDIIDYLFRTGTCEGEVIDPVRINESQKAVVEKKRGGLSSRCQIAAISGWKPNKRVFEDESLSNQLSQDAIMRLNCFKYLRSVIKCESKNLFNHKSILLRFFAWKACFRCYTEMRRQNKQIIYNERAIYFLEGFHPRASLKKLSLWLIGNIFLKFFPRKK